MEKKLKQQITKEKKREKICNLDFQRYDIFWLVIYSKLTVEVIRHPKNRNKFSWKCQNMIGIAENTMSKIEFDIRWISSYDDFCEQPTA